VDAFVASITNSRSSRVEHKKILFSHQLIIKKRKEGEKKGKKKDHRRSPCMNPSAMLWAYGPSVKWLWARVNLPFPVHITPSIHRQRSNGALATTTAEAAQWKRGIREELLDFDASRQRRRAEQQVSQ
jgi:hypothetical protein